MRARERASGRESPKCVDDQAALAHRLELPHRPFEELPWGESIHIHDKDHIGRRHREEQIPSAPNVPREVLFDLDDRDACVGDGARPKRQSERDAGDPLAASTLRATTGAARASSGDPSSTIKKWTWSRITAGNVFQRRTLCSKWRTSQ